MVHAGNTTYAACKHPNSINPIHRNNMVVNRYKKRKEKRNKHLLRETLEYLPGTVSDKCHCMGGGKPPGFTSAQPHPYPIRCLMFGETYFEQNFSDLLYTAFET